MSLPRDLYNGFIFLVAEFLGTFFFIFLSFFSVQGGSPRPNTPPPAQGHNAAGQLYIAAAWGASYAVSLAIFWRFSGGLFNPILTIAMMLNKRIRPLRALSLLPTQFLATLSAAGLAKGLLPDHQALSAKVELAPGLTSAQGLWIEVFAVFVLVSAALATVPETRRRGLVTPAALGLILFAIQLPTLPYTGAGLNPFRAFAPSAVDRSFQPSQWIYWLGPFLGVLLAWSISLLLKHHERQTEDLVTVPIVRHKSAKSTNSYKTQHWGVSPRIRDEEWGSAGEDEKRLQIPPLAVPPYGGFAYAGAPMEQRVREQREQEQEEEDRRNPVPNAPPRYSYSGSGRPRRWSDDDGQGPPSSWRGRLRGFEAADRSQRSNAPLRGLR